MYPSLDCSPFPFNARVAGSPLLSTLHPPFREMHSRNPSPITLPAAFVCFAEIRPRLHVFFSRHSLPSQPECSQHHASPLTPSPSLDRRLRECFVPVLLLLYAFASRVSSLRIRHRSPVLARNNREIVLSSLSSNVSTPSVFAKSLFPRGPSSPFRYDLRFLFLSHLHRGSPSSSLPHFTPHSLLPDSSPHRNPQITPSPVSLVLAQHKIFISGEWGSELSQHWCWVHEVARVKMIYGDDGVLAAGRAGTMVVIKFAGR